MTRKVDFGFGVGDKEETETIDFHDKEISLQERALVHMLLFGSVTCLDLDVSEEELEGCMSEIEMMLDDGDMPASPRKKRVH